MAKTSNDLLTERAQLSEKMSVIDLELGKLVVSDFQRQASEHIERARSLLAKAQDADLEQRQAQDERNEAQREARIKSLRTEIAATGYTYVSTLANGLQCLRLAGETLTADEEAIINDPSVKLADCGLSIRPSTWSRLPDQVSLRLTGLRQSLNRLHTELAAV
jgi:hypothetical protein